MSTARLSTPLAYHGSCIDEARWTETAILIRTELTHACMKEPDLLFCFCFFWGGQWGRGWYDYQQPTRLHTIELDLWPDNLHCVSKKVPTFIVSVTLSSLNRFSHVLHCWKVWELFWDTE